MTMDLATHYEDDAIVERAETDGRRIDVRLTRWGEVATHTNEGYREALMRGAFDGVDPATVTLESSRHGGALVGVAESIVERNGEPIATFRVAPTPAGDELLTLVKEGILRAASVVFHPRLHRVRGGVIERTSVDLRRVALLERGAYPSAQVLAVREERIAMDPEENVTAEETTETCEEKVAAATAVLERNHAASITPLISRIDALDAKVAAASSTPAGKTNELARFGSFGDLVMAAYDEPELARDWTTNVTGDNDGVMSGGPSWLSDIKRIVAQGRPAVTAFGGAKALTETGMVVNWPVAPNGTYVAVQATQGTEVVSSQIDIDDDNAPVVTYAGGAGVSYQLLKRSSPAYREAILRLILSSWAQVTTGAFAAALVAGAGKAISTRMCFGATKTISTSAHSDDIIDSTAHGFAIGQPVVFLSKSGGNAAFPILGRVYWVTATSFAANTFRVSETPGGAPVEWDTADLEGTAAGLIDTTGAYYRALLFEASSAVQDATGAPGLSVIASTDTFLLLGGFTGLVPAQYGTQNVSGTADAASLRININGLDVVHEPRLAAGNVIVGNDVAANWLEEGPHPITQESARTLSQDSVFYSFNASGIYVPAGLAKLRAA